MIVCSFGYFSVPVVTKRDDKDANVASTTLDDRDANMETASSASTSLVSNPHVLILCLDFKPLRAIFPHVDSEEIASALATCYGDEDAADSLLLDKQLDLDSNSTLSGQADNDLCTFIAIRTISLSF